MIQTKIFDSVNCDYVHKLQDNVNAFLKNLTNAKIVDIKYISIGTSSVTAMVVYEVYQDSRSYRPVSKGTL